jgi:dihydroorotase-like cyclic amidohydrolase
MTIQGRVVQTVLRGQMIYEGDKVLATEGDGEFIPAHR